MAKKTPKPPVWWKNTFFLFGFLLLALAVWGLVAGERVIRDPGQKFETGLVGFYCVAGLAMLLNGWMTHKQAMQHYADLYELEGVSADASAPEDNEE